MTDLPTLLKQAEKAGVLPKFMHWLLVDPEDGVLRHFDKKHERDAIESVASLYQRVIDCEVVTKEKWVEVREAIHPVGACPTEGGFIAWAAAGVAYIPGLLNDVSEAAIIYDKAHSTDHRGAYGYVAKAKQAKKLTDLLKEAGVEADA